MWWCEFSENFDLYATGGCWIVGQGGTGSVYVPLWSSIMSCNRCICLLVELQIHLPNLCLIMPAVSNLQTEIHMGTSKVASVSWWVVQIGPQQIRIM
jgi:hypothetical protein